MPESAPGQQEQPQPQQAPFGVSPTTGPTPNAGYKAAAFQKLGVFVNGLTELLPLLGATSEEGQAVMKALTTLSKIVPTGSNSQAGERNVIEQMAMKNQQNSALQQQMKAGMAKPGGAAGAPPQMPSAA